MQRRLLLNRGEGRVSSSSFEIDQTSSKSSDQSDGKDEEKEAKPLVSRIQLIFTSKLLKFPYHRREMQARRIV